MVAGPPLCSILSRTSENRRAASVALSCFRSPRSLRSFIESDYLIYRPAGLATIRRAGGQGQKDLAAQAPVITLSGSTSRRSAQSEARDWSRAVRGSWARG